VHSRSGSGRQYATSQGLAALAFLSLPLFTGVRRKGVFPEGRLHDSCMAAEVHNIVMFIFLLSMAKSLSGALRL
jgi:hypothetical protein